MTRFIHDQFSKDYLEALLKPYGKVEAPRRVAGEVRQIDVLFTPREQQTSSLQTLGLLGKFANSPALIEPFRNAASIEEICDCLLKLLEVRGELQREANRNTTQIPESALPKLWILTPTASAALLASFGAILDRNWLPGVHIMPVALRTAIVAIHQLPRTTETLWLRVLGRGNVQKQAIDGLEALPADNPFQTATLQLLYNLQQNLAMNQNIEEDDKELIMRLAPLYEQDRERAKLEGKQEGEQNLVIRQLNRRLGNIDSSLIEQVQGLSIEQLEILGEALLDFSEISDLEVWLNQALE
jgi:Domain of unknown function (DUF4351)